MDNLEQVSDDELRRRLLQYGLPNIPVTMTTRKTLIKRLRLVMEGEKAKLRRQTTMATRYSSDEESDNNHSARSRATNRNTVASTNNRLSTKSQPSVNNSAFARPSPVPVQSNPLAANRRFMAPRTPPQPPTPLRTTTTAKRSPIYVSPLLQGSGEDSEEDEDYDDDDLGAETTSGSHNFNNNLANDKLFSRHSSYGGSQQQMQNGRPQQHLGDSSPSSSPYLSDFTQRLLNLRGTTVQSETSKGNSSFTCLYISYHSIVIRFICKKNFNLESF